MLSKIALIGALMALSASGLPPSVGKAHDFHVSKCLVEYVEGEQSLQISLHLFIDDLELALAEQGANDLFLCTEREAPEAETYLFRYLQQRFRLTVNQEEVTYRMIGKEISDDLMAVWCYLEVRGISELRELEMENSLLMEIYADQKNIVSVKGPGQERGLLLFERGKMQRSVTFDP